MATADAIPTPPETGAFKGCCFVLPASDPEATAESINTIMGKRVVDAVGDTLVLIETRLLLLPRQIIVLLTHGGQANLYVCDTMEVHQ
jgi:hypothetical protein